MKVAVIGAGAYVLGRGTAGFGTILPALCQASKRIEFEEVTVCSTSARGALDVDRVAAELNARLGSRLRVSHRVFDDALSSGRFRSLFDCAIVSVPDDLHFAVVRRVLQAGLHCLVVKPFVTTLEEANQLISLADARGLYGAVDFHKRFDESNLVVRRMLGEGRLGDPAYASVEYSQPINVPRDLFASWATRTNIFQYLGVHYVDLLYFMTGYQPRRLTAAGHRGVLAASGIDTYDSIHVIVEWSDATGQSSFVSQFAVGWIDPELSSAVSEQRYVLVGSRGRVDCDQKHRGLRVTAAEGINDINPYFSDYLAFEGSLEFSGYGYRSVERFLLDVRDIKHQQVNPAPLEARRPSLRSARVSTTVLEAVRESLTKGSEWKDVRDSF